MQIYNFLKLALLALALGACTNHSNPAEGTAALAQLTTKDMYSFASQGVGFGESYIKFVVFVEDKELSIEYFDSNKMKLHVDYLKSVKGVTLSSEEIYKLARFNEGRKYFFGALIRTEHVNSNDPTLSFQITSQDILSVENIIRLGKLIYDSLENPEPLSYLPSGNQSKAVSDIAVQKQLELAGFPVQQISAFQSKTYFSAMVPGRLKKVKAKDIEDGIYLIQGDEILLLDHVPDSLPPVRGVITALPTSPSSHVSLLANMYSIPFLYVQNAFESKELAALDGKLLLFKSYEGHDSNDLYLAEPLSESVYNTLEDSWLHRFPKVPLSLNDKNLTSLDSFPVIGSGDSDLNVGTCGAKATNGNILVQAIGSKNSIEGFCIPFYFFNKFMQTNKVGDVSLKTFILSEMSKITAQPKLEFVQATLNTIKQQINAAKVSSEDIQNIKQMIKKTYEGKTTVSKIRFRSSSNAEDDERFNGAGLYESDGLKLEHVIKDNDKKIEESLKIVWSSLYGLRAVMARKMFQIDENKVNMAILVNQAFEETANGVSICQYPYISSQELNCMIEGYPGGELSVAHPTPGSTTEILRTQANKNYPFGVMDTLIQHTSELMQFERLLAPKEVGELFQLQEKIYTHWSTEKKPGFKGMLDFEWKRMTDATTGESYMALKQVREVPQKLSFGLPEPTLIFPQDAVIYTGGLDGSISLEALMTSRKIRIAIPKFTKMNDVAKIKSESKLYSDDFSGINIPLPIQSVDYNDGIWTYDEYEKTEFKNVRLTISVKHPKLNELKISISYKQLRKNNALVHDNIVDTRSAQLEVSLLKNQITNNKKDKDWVHNYGGFDSFEKVIEPKTKNFCIKGEVVASIVETIFSAGLYNDGNSHMDSAKLTKKAFKVLKSEFSITDRHALVSSRDSHAFKAGQYTSTFSVYVDSKTAKSAGLKEEDHFVVIASGSNFESEQPLDDVIILYNSKREVVEKRKLSECPGEEEDESESGEFSGAG